MEEPRLPDHLCFPVFVLYPHPGGEVAGRPPFAVLSRATGRRLVPVFTDEHLAQRYAWSMVEGAVQTSGPSLVPTAVAMTAARLLSLLETAGQFHINGVVFDPPETRSGSSPVTCTVQEAVELVRRRQ